MILILLMVMFMDYSVTMDGKALSKDLYSIDLDNKVFISKETGLVIDFTGLSGWTFKVDNHCTFTTNHGCNFNTGRNCTFTTSDVCSFNTGRNCTFTTEWGCTFSTGSRCVFKTGYWCTFSIYDISSQMFKLGSSGVIIDRAGGNHYLLNEEFIRMRNVLKG